MNKYEMFDALNDYHNNLSHAQSKLYGSKQDNTKYYNRIGKPGEYRYFYTKAEWDAYQEAEARKKYEAEKKAKQEAEKRNDMSGYNDWKKEEARKTIRLPEKQPTSLKDINENNLPYINVQNEKAKKLMKEVVEAEKKDKAIKRAGMEGYEEWAEKKRQERIKKAETAGKAGMTGYEQWYKDIGKRRAIQDKIKADLKNVSGAEELKKTTLEVNTKKANELKEQGKYVDAYKLLNADTIKENSEKMREDENSPLNTMEDIIDYETYTTEEEFNQLVEDYNSGELTARLRQNDNDIQDIYQWIAENKETEEVDPTNGLKIKNYELTTEEEMKIVNPGYYLSDQEYDYQLIYGPEVLNTIGPTGYANNCYACTQAMALRKQGYDVTPGQDFDGAYSEHDLFTGKDVNTNDPELGTPYNKLWTGDFTTYDDYKATSSKINKEPAGSYGDFNFEVTLGPNQTVGHSVFYEVQSDGSVLYYDCQNGMVYDETYMKNLYEMYSNFTSRYKRLDNQTFKGAEKMKAAKKLSKSLNNIKGGIVQ